MVSYMVSIGKAILCMEKFGAEMLRFWTPDIVHVILIRPRAYLPGLFNA